ncbi:hypothetical protein Glove_22g21 [Diversispora epigaea]|uniref:Fe2OG dioxygenase domain-containing protein n=1 Tax=Diversispora epigaea TaxID=1348612 RepID=A0A397JJK4_9GLOM|nr:hypothetical protein Glove_22g21 [Diversispora epigaea]
MVKKIETSLDGLCIIEDFITKDEEKDLIKKIDSNEWCGLGIPPNPEMKRRTQHYGYEFSYRYRKIMNHLGSFPDFINFLIQRFINQNIINNINNNINDNIKDIPNMCIINEYMAGQGIMPHTDSPSLFGPVILSLSLLSPCLMKFEHKDFADKSEVVLLRPRSLVIMTKSSRYDYKHSISKDLIEYFFNNSNNNNDNYNGGNDNQLNCREEIIRSRRISLTFRTIIENNSYSEQEQEQQEY